MLVRPAGPRWRESASSVPARHDLLAAAVVVAPSDVPEDVRAAVTADWVSAWIRLTAERLLSYADENASP